MTESLLQRWFPHPFVSVIVAMSWVMLAIIWKPAHCSWQYFWPS